MMSLSTIDSVVAEGEMGLIGEIGGSGAISAASPALIASTSSSAPANSREC
jgi:hypothetical protein